MMIVVWPTKVEDEDGRENLCDAGKFRKWAEDIEFIGLWAASGETKKLMNCKGRG